MARPPASVEHERLRGLHGDVSRWRRWGPYVAERAWGTVREDYSASGDAWSYLPHDLARSKAYRWGEDGLAAVCDRYQVLVLALALWNERDPILKERLFGLVPSEANHGEDVKELYWYLDATPTHSYLRWLYKYPHAEFPYARLVEGNRARHGTGPELELLDTGVLDGDRYFDVTVEYAKIAPEDLAMRVTVANRGPDPAPLHVLPHLWFRNTWGWTRAERPEPVIRPGPAGDGYASLVADDSAADPPSALLETYRVGERHLYFAPGAEALFTGNETHAERVFGPGARSRRPWVKDAFHRRVVNGETGAVNPAREGTKACVWTRLEVPAGGTVTLDLRLAPAPVERPLEAVGPALERARREADAFYDAVHPPELGEDERRVQRQAFAGLLWSKQVYLYDVDVWLDGDEPAWAPPASRHAIRNQHWRHLNSMRILLVPDKWEYPWFASWDLAFQAVAVALVDAELAKEQLWLMLFEQFQHPSGQLPAYEWEFSDLNPPVHAWGVWRVYNMDRIRQERADREFLERCFHKLLLNFTWWVNRADRLGNNIFEGGFLGLDNITVFDRSARMDGVVLEQSDATGWMGMFCLNMMRIALELARENPVYEGLATKFFEHYVYVAKAMKRMAGSHDLWDPEDGFFYDVLAYQDGRRERFRLRSLVGLIPMYAVERLEERWIQPFGQFRENFAWFLRNRPDLVEGVVHRVEHGGEVVHVLCVFDLDQLRGMMRRILDPEEFLSPWGLRSLSKHHATHPFGWCGEVVRYEPGHTDSKLKGGNSNWRGPVWFPTTFLMIESLRKLGTAWGADLKVPSRGAGGEPISLRDAARLFAERLVSLFVRGPDGRRSALGPSERLQRDPLFRDHLLFHEFFDAETGEGLGASHQTGWTALVASLLDEWPRPER